MSSTVFADNAKVMSKGRVTMPKDVRAVLGVEAGDKVTFIVEGSVVRVVNTASYAMQLLQQQMTGQAATAGIASEDDVAELVSGISVEA